MPGVMTQSEEKAQQQETGAQNECGHQNLVKVESEISEVDTDVQIYRCAMCRRSFAVTAY
jgi:transposase-like protein